MSPDQFKQIMPQAPVSIYAPLAAAMAEWQINTPKRVAAFVANLAAESRQLTVLSENLNYSADQLARTWPPRYANVDKTPNDLARDLARKGAQAIANNVYANRMGNGDEASGDGWRNRGAGGLQLTGATNQRECAKAFGIAPDTIGDWLRTPEGACRSAARHWILSGCNTYADKGDFDGCCDMVNIGRKTDKIGDAIGFATREQVFVTACKVLGVPA